jgi:crossover junction endodeoxyribonuclease RusA
VVVRGRARKAYRLACREACFECFDLTGAEAVALEIDFHPPEDKAKRDLDNLLASFKAGIDGFCDAHKIDDYSISSITLRRCQRVCGGIVVVRAFAFARPTHRPSSTAADWRTSGAE